MLNLKRNQKGFTLVELLIVVVILGILAEVALPRFLTARDSAQLRTCQSNMAAINSALEEYALNNNLTAPDAAAFSAANSSTYFPDGAPQCPAGGTYTLDTGTGRATCDGVGGDDVVHGSLSDWST
jgi:type IV pilus assembly protein PilA